MKVRELTHILNTKYSHSLWLITGTIRNHTISNIITITIIIVKSQSNKSSTP